MNCPNCHCHRGEPLTVAVNSLVTRCHHAFHAVATAEAPPLNEPLHPQSPVTPDDFAQQKPAQDATALESPYTTPIPTLHDGSTGWVYCEACDAPQPVAGHECVKPATLGCGDPCPTSAPCFRCRAEFAESLLCAMAFDHAAFLGERLFCVRSRRDRVTHGLGCVFCDAARSA